MPAVNQEDKRRTETVELLFFQSILELTIYRKPVRPKPVRSPCSTEAHSARQIQDQLAAATLQVPRTF